MLPLSRLLPHWDLWVPSHIGMKGDRCSHLEQRSSYNFSRKRSIVFVKAATLRPIVCSSSLKGRLRKSFCAVRRVPCKCVRARPKMSNTAGLKCSTPGSARTRGCLLKGCERRFRRHLDPERRCGALRTGGDGLRISAPLWQPVADVRNRYLRQPSLRHHQRP